MGRTSREKDTVLTDAAGSRVLTSPATRLDSVVGVTGEETGVGAVGAVFVLPGQATNPEITAISTANSATRYISKKILPAAVRMSRKTEGKACLKENIG